MAIEGQRRPPRPGQRDELAHDVHDLQVGNDVGLAHEALEPIAGPLCPSRPYRFELQAGNAAQNGNSDSASSPTDPDQREDPIRW